MPRPSRGRRLLNIVPAIWITCAETGFLASEVAYANEATKIPRDAKSAVGATQYRRSQVEREQDLRRLDETQRDLLREVSFTLAVRHGSRSALGHRRPMTSAA